MNLARVEHYFSDFLSCLESGDPVHLHASDAVASDERESGPSIPKTLRIPPNLFITGTVNIDETTFMFSPKVLDRAFTIEFNEVILEDTPVNSLSPLQLKKLPTPLGCVRGVNKTDWISFTNLANGNLRDLVMKLHQMLAVEHRHFGYRVTYEIARFVNLAAEQAGPIEDTLWAALDIAVLQKVLPKFNGTQQELEDVLLRLFAFAIEGEDGGKQVRSDWTLLSKGLVAADPISVPASVQPRLPRTAAKLWRMLRRLDQQGFTSCME